MDNETITISYMLLILPAILLPAAFAYAFVEVQYYLGNRRAARRQ